MFRKMPTDQEAGAVNLQSSDTLVAHWQQHTLSPGTAAALHRLDPAEPKSLSGSLAGIRIRGEKTPAEFSHLYATLERQVAGVSESGRMGRETLGAERPYVLGVTSAVVGEGKTTVALHLAMSAARNTFKKVCLIDLSLGQDDLCRRLGAPSLTEGVITVLEDTDQALPLLQLDGCDNLVIMPAGKAPSNAAKAVRSPRVAELIGAARRSFDIIIVDLPAVATDNALPLTAHVDGVVVVARAGATPKEVVAHALDHLGHKKVLGVVLNRVKSSCPRWLQKRFLEP